MSEYKPLDATADVLPVGLHPTPFGEVWQALQQVAASVWDVDPSVYRAGIAWLWYALRNPAALDADGLRPLLVAALISEQAPLVKDTQTAAELADYLRLWRNYTPTYPKLEALYGVFAADVEILPITAQGYAPPSNTRLAFFVVIRGIDFDRPLTADEAALIAVRATPLGSHPVVVTELSEDFSLPVYPMRAGVPAISVENDAICEPVASPLPVIHTHYGTQTSASIAPDASFDTGLTYDSNNLYIGETNDGLGDVTRYGWEAEEGPEPPSYTEITLYMVSGQKNSQGGIRSSFNGNVESSYVYPLYTDSGLTTRFVYDYSNDYEIGYYVSGVWTPKVQNVSDLPSSSTEFKLGYILLDVGSLWFVCSGSSVGMNFSSIIVRIYPKEQQQYSLYFSQNSNTYNNYSTSGGMAYNMKHRPGNIANGWMPWSDSFPARTIVKAMYSSGKSNIAIDRLSWNGTDDISIILASGYAPSFRNVIFTLDVPTYTSWANLSGNKSAESNEVCPLFDKNGEYVVYDPTMNYTIIGLFNYSGGHPFSSPNRFMLDAQLGGFDTGNPTRLCFKLNRAVTFSYVWYIKTPEGV